MARRTSFAHIREEARRLFNKGDYREAVIICDRLLTSLAKRAGDASATADIRRVLNDKSRALRNLGMIQPALDCYVLALRSAHESGSKQDEAWQLVQFGKIFGKYLERQTLFSACLREAARRYEHFMQEGDSTSRLTTQFAVVQDLLGSYYRRLGERRREAVAARVECERSYLRSIELHRKSDNIEGISRASCHLAYARALFAHSEPTLSNEQKKSALRSALRSFEESVRIVLRSPEAKRGRATRRVQQAHIYLLLGSSEHAAQLLADAMLSAHQRNDPRAIVLARRLLASVLIEQRKSIDALQELERARDLAEEMKLLGFERRILSDLAELYLQLGEPQEAIRSLQKNEVLLQNELLEFDSGFSGAFDVFQTVAPERADFYLREGQRQDYEEFISALIDTGRMLRLVISRHDRAQSVRLQAGIHRFVKIALGHAIKNELQNFSLALLPLRKSMEEKEPLEPYVSGLLQTYAQTIDRIKPLLADKSSEQISKKASLRQELMQAIQLHFEGCSFVEISLPFDILFPDLMPGLLREAFLHLVENARAAIQKSPPAMDESHLTVQLKIETEGIQLILMNPGVNPSESPYGEGSSSSALHGFTNAYWFFREVLGFDCAFELREDGPRTPPHLCNCVVIMIPPPGRSPTPYQIAAVQ